MEYPAEEIDICLDCLVLEKIMGHEMNPICDLVGDMRLCILDHAGEILDDELKVAC